MKAAKILIADDELIGRQLLEAVLIQEGYEIHLAKNGDEVIEKSNAIVPDLILLDIMMPEKDGFTIIKVLKDSTVTKNIPIIFLSALDDRDTINKGLGLGAIDYISKPFDRIELITKIKNSIGLHNNVSSAPSQNSDIDEVTKNNHEVILEELNLISGNPFDLSDWIDFRFAPEGKSQIVKSFLTGRNNILCIYGINSSDENSGFYLSLFKIWLLELCFKEQIDLHSAFQHLKNKIDLQSGNKDEVLPFWFILLDKTTKNEHIAVFGQDIFNTDIITNSEEVTIKFTPIIIQENILPKNNLKKDLYFFSKNISQLLLTKKTIPYLKSAITEFNWLDLEETLKTISDYLGAHNSFIVRLRL